MPVTGKTQKVWNWVCYRVALLSVSVETFKTLVHSLPLVQLNQEKKKNWERWSNSSFLHIFSWNILCKDVAEAKDKKNKYIPSQFDQTRTTSHTSKYNTRQAGLSTFIVPWSPSFLGSQHNYWWQDQQEGPAVITKCPYGSRFRRVSGELVPPSWELLICSGARHQPCLQTHHPEEIAWAAI